MPYIIFSQMLDRNWGAGWHLLSLLLATKPSRRIRYASKQYLHIWNFNNLLIDSPTLSCLSCKYVKILKIKTVALKKIQQRYKKNHKEKGSSFFGLSGGLIFWQHVASFWQLWTMNSIWLDILVWFTQDWKIAGVNHVKCSTVVWML